MDRPSFVYTTYIHTTPERLWQALTEPGLHRGATGASTFDTDWTGRLAHDAGSRTA